VSCAVLRNVRNVCELQEREESSSSGSSSSDEGEYEEGSVKGKVQKKLASSIKGKGKEKKDKRNYTGGF
jgi:hypothetical protein